MISDSEADVVVEHVDSRSGEWSPFCLSGIAPTYSCGDLADTGARGCGALGLAEVVQTWL